MPSAKAVPKEMIPLVDKPVIQYVVEKAVAGITEEFVQDNQSVSSVGVLRGLHFQKQPHTQDKIVRVLSGRIFDVAVDLRQGSPTYAQWFGIELSGENHKMLYIPIGFAHGFLALTDVTITYKCTAGYNRDSESGIIWNDPVVNIEWPDVEGISISEKDTVLPLLSELDNEFVYDE